MGRLFGGFRGMPDVKSRVGWLIVFLSLVATSLAACRSANTLEDKVWALEFYDDNGNMLEVLEGAEITALFDSSEKFVSGTSGCNSYFGDYELKGSRLLLSNISYTEMYCSEPRGVMEQEQRYLKALLAAESYQIRDEQLLITSGNDALIFRVK